MPSYAAKPPMTLKKNVAPGHTDLMVSPEAIDAAIEANPVVEDKPVEIEPEFVSIAGLASQGRDALVDKLRDHMVKSAPKEYVPPAPTARQMSQTEREMEAGRKATARHAEQQIARPQPKPEASDGYTTPVFRPGDTVPGFNSADPRAQTLK